MENHGNIESQQESFRRIKEELRHSPVAIHTDAANIQHYEIPPEFYVLILGKHLKYSCCYYPTGNENLDEAEEIMLKLTCERALIENGMNILELGCGWGSLTLWMAQNYPDARITGVSNSRSQREYIETRCRDLGISNVKILTADMNTFSINDTFDRIVSVEMFEHMKNYDTLLKKISSWMRPDAKLFVHIFTHLRYTYHFEIKDASDWMGKYFFTGGIMPSDQLLLYFQDHLILEDHWRVNGMHYKRTADHWLANMDLNKTRILPVIAAIYGNSNKHIWFQRWRIFFMACAELWGFNHGEEWLVSHYLFHKRS